MNRKVMASLLVIGVVGAAAGGSTFALFNDTETSEDNTFEAGALDLKVDWVEYYNGELESEQELTDLEGDSAIFNLGDVKPGDEGVANISLHVYDNPAHVFMNMTQTANYENGCTEPEAEVDDTCGDAGDEQGELGEHLYFTVYNAEDEVIFDGTAEELDAEGLDENYLGEFDNSTTEWVRVEWHVPRETGNVIQTDAKEFEFEFYAEQARHNDVPGDGEEENETDDNQTDDNKTPVNETENYTSVNWQVDLAEGQVIEDLANQSYSDRGDLERARHGFTNGTGPHKADEGNYHDLSECITNTSEFEVSGDAEDPEAEVTFDIKDKDDCESINVTLASYENTGDIGWDDGSNQILDSHYTEEVDAGEEDYTMSVDLPAAEIE